MAKGVKNRDARAAITRFFVKRVEQSGGVAPAAFFRGDPYRRNADGRNKPTPERSLRVEQERVADNFPPNRYGARGIQGAERVVSKPREASGGCAPIGVTRRMDLSEALEIAFDRLSNNEITLLGGWSRTVCRKLGPAHAPMLAPNETMLTEEQKGEPTGEQTREGSAQSAKLGGAGADFVASLGRKSAEARAVLAALDAEPASKALREDVRRRFDALRGSARMFRFSSMEKALAEGLRLFDRATSLEALPPHDTEIMAQILEDLPALAWEDDGRASSIQMRRARKRREMLPQYTTLIVGKSHIGEALLSEVADARVKFECSVTEDVQAAFDLACKGAPDLIVIDADLDPTAVDLVEALMDDTTTEAVPMLVLGSFPEPGDAARFVAMGVSRTLQKPLSHDQLRRGCEDVLFHREGKSSQEEIGTPTVAELGERLADEVRKALVESVDGAVRDVNVPLGEGAEVLGALWGAIARVREVVTARTGGAVRFSTQGPLGAIAMAPHLDAESPFAQRSVSRRGPSVDVKLEGRKVLVVDDDPAVTWYIADLLRTAGCVVEEALDGECALNLAYRNTPDLVVSDILMPNMDGFALCKALKRDVALHDVPVVLLSWKEDLLARVRALGANASAYIRKESEARAIVARMREVLRPKARVEARLGGDQEVRGRLDGLSVRTLLEIACAVRPFARLSLRDATHLYEIEIRNGAPVRAVRTSNDDDLLRGKRALASMLGVTSGRFTLANESSEVEPNLEGNLATQLAKPIAVSRAAISLITGDALMNVVRVSLDEHVTREYLRATPDQIRHLLRQIDEGVSPRDLVLSGEVEPRLLDEVLTDMATRGAISAVFGEDGHDRLRPRAEDLVSRGDLRTEAELAKFTPPPPQVSIAAQVEAIANLPDSVPPPPHAEKVESEASLSDESELEAIAEAALAAKEAVEITRNANDDEFASSFEDAVLRELNHSPIPAKAAVIEEKSSLDLSEPLPLVEPSPSWKEAASANPNEAPTFDPSLSPNPIDNVVLTEKTEVDDVSYVANDDAQFAAIDPIEQSKRLAEAPSQPLAEASGTAEAPAAEGARSPLWPLVAVAVGASSLVWAILYFAN